MLAPGLTRIDEPHVDPLLAANIWHLRGADRDLVVDTGLGVGVLRADRPELFERDPIVVVTHGHLDHAGGAHEFDAVHAHPADRLETPLPGSLHGPALLAELGADAAGWDDPVPELLVDALPSAHDDPDAYRLRPPRAVIPVEDGDVIEAAGRRLTVLHLPGHTPGTIALFDERDGVLFSGDFVYDDLLLDELRGSDIAAYAASMRRVRALPVAVVHPGHGASFDGIRLREIADAYLARRG